MPRNEAIAIRPIGALRPNVGLCKHNRADSATWLDRNEEGIPGRNMSLLGAHLSRICPTRPSFWHQGIAAEGAFPTSTPDLPGYLVLHSGSSANASYSCYLLDANVLAAPEQANTSTWVLFNSAVTHPTQFAGTLLVERLQAMKSGYPSMSAQFDDAIIFAKLFNDDLAQPAIWTDEEAEVVLEWMLPIGRHAVVSFEGDGEFGYTLRIADKFVPGTLSGSKPFRLPDDLVQYILAK